MREPQYFDIPLGTPPAKCKGETCGATIYFVQTRTGRMMPVSVDYEGCRAPDTFPEGQQNMFGGTDVPQPGRGVAHFIDCPDAGAFSRGGRDERQRPGSQHGRP